MMNRFFVSIPISESYRKAFSVYAQKYPKQGMRWVSPENFHVTLHFIGDVPKESISKMTELLKKVAATHRPFKLTFKEVVFGPPGGHKRLIWGEFEACDEFQAICKEIEPAQVRATIPHVTIGRIKNVEKAKTIELVEPDIQGPIEVKQIELQSSKLTPHGAVYEVIASFVLSGDVNK